MNFRNGNNVNGFERLIICVSQINSNWFKSNHFRGSIKTKEKRRRKNVDATVDALSMTRIAKEWTRKKNNNNEKINSLVAYFRLQFYKLMLQLKWRIPSATENFSMSFALLWCSLNRRSSAFLEHNYGWRVI